MVFTNPMAGITIGIVREDLLHGGKVASIP
jgi:hypothetical protein